MIKLTYLEKGLIKDGEWDVKKLRLLMEKYQLSKKIKSLMSLENEKKFIHLFVEPRSYMPREQIKGEYVLLEKDLRTKTMQYHCFKYGEEQCCIVKIKEEISKMLAPK